MFAKMTLGMMLVLLLYISDTDQQFAGCAESYYLHDGSCKSCPERCATCISDFNCTKCKGSSYGPLCQHTCQEVCENFCHKEYGYCTYGCVDGQFPVKNSSQCAICPAKCNLCNSKTACAECLSGYYGSSCEDRCPTHCRTCNKTTGACLECDERYFYQDGKCRACPDGCVSCHDNTNCSSCQTGYSRLNDGQCIIDCSMGSNMTGLELARHLTENETFNCCTKASLGQKCVHQTRKPCMQHLPCSSDSICPSKYDVENTCGTIQAYQCSQTCHRLNESNCQCYSNCTLIEKNQSAILLCLTSQHHFQVIQLSTDSECSCENQPTSTYQPPTTNTNIPVVVSVIFGIMCLAMAFYIIWMKRCHKVRASRRDPVNAEETYDMLDEESRGETINQSSPVSPPIVASNNSNQRSDSSKNGICQNNSGKVDTPYDSCAGQNPFNPSARRNAFSLLFPVFFRK